MATVSQTIPDIACVQVIIPNSVVTATASSAGVYTGITTNGTSKFNVASSVLGYCSAVTSGACTAWADVTTSNVTYDIKYDSSAGQYSIKMCPTVPSQPMAIGEVVIYPVSELYTLTNSDINGHFTITPGAGFIYTTT